MRKGEQQILIYWWKVPEQRWQATRLNSGELEYVHIDPESDVSDLLLALVRATEGAGPVPLPATPHRISKGTVSRIQHCFKLFLRKTNLRKNAENFKELLIGMCRVYQIFRKVPNTVKKIGMYLYRYRAKPFKRYGPCPSRLGYDPVFAMTQ